MATTWCWCFETAIVCPSLFLSMQLYWNFKLYCFYFLQNLHFQIGGAAYLRMRLIHGCLQYSKHPTSQYFFSADNTNELDQEL